MVMGKYLVKVYELTDISQVRAYTLDGADAKAKMIYGDNDDTIVRVEEVTEDG